MHTQKILIAVLAYECKYTNRRRKTKKKEAIHMQKNLFTILLKATKKANLNNKIDTAILRKCYK